MLHVQHASCCNVLTLSPKRLTTTRACNIKSLILCLCMKTYRAKKVKVHFAYFAQRDQLGIVTKLLT